MEPFWSPTFRWPLSGDVTITQDIEPNFLSPRIEGIPEVEWEVITSVASYGKQLGKLTEAVLALAEATGVEGEAIDAVRELADGVGAAKLRARDAVRARAEKAAERAAKLDSL